MTNKHSNFNTFLLLVLRLSAFFVFFGRGWEHLITDAPFRTVLWDQYLMEGIITSLTNLSWHQYASSPTCNFIIDAFVKITGLFYLLCAVVSLFIKAGQKHLSKLLMVGTLFLISLSLLFYKNKFLQFGQLIEYSCQMFSPLFLYLMLFGKIHLNKLNFVLKLSIALTFAGHGLYALGAYITPGVWTDMALSSLNFIGLYPSISQVENIIYLAGIFDMILAICIFLPNKWSTPFLCWAILWGLITALSRVIGFINIDASWHTLIQWLPQTILRLPHALLPMAVLLILFKEGISQSSKQILFHPIIQSN